MKKIIALFVLMVGVGFTANAQQKKPAKTAVTTSTTGLEAEIQKAAEADTKALNAAVTLSNDQLTSFKGLFEYNHRALKENNLSDERKKLLAETIEAKINATLTPDQITKLSQNPTLLKGLSTGTRS